MAEKALPFVTASSKAPLGACIQLRVLTEWLRLVSRYLSRNGDDSLWMKLSRILRVSALYGAMPYVVRSGVRRWELVDVAVLSTYYHTV